MFFRVVLVLCIAVAAIDAQADCTGLPDGPCCAGCHSYTECTGGVGVTVNCPLPDEAYNEDLQRCDSIENTPPPCGKNHNCQFLQNRKYPDMTPGQECEAFFTCSNGINLGTSPCNPPDSNELVFHYTQQICNWRYDVPPPCGTYVVPPNPRF